jgi:hypothetical protein
MTILKPLNILDGTNAMTEKFFGYPIFGYWKLFNTEEAGKLLDNHASILITICCC